MQYARDDEGHHFCIKQNKTIDNDLIYKYKFPNHLARLKNESETMMTFVLKVQSQSLIISGWYLPG